MLINIAHCPYATLKRATTNRMTRSRRIPPKAAPTPTTRTMARIESHRVLSPPYKIWTGPTVTRPPCSMPNSSGRNASIRSL